MADRPRKYRLPNASTCNFCGKCGLTDTAEDYALSHGQLGGEGRRAGSRLLPALVPLLARASSARRLTAPLAPIFPGTSMLLAMEQTAQNPHDEAFQFYSRPVGFLAVNFARAGMQGLGMLPCLGVLRGGS